MTTTYLFSDIYNHETFKLIYDVNPSPVMGSLFDLVPIAFPRKIGPIEEQFPSLLSILKDIPLQVRIFLYALKHERIQKHFLSWHKYDLFIKRMNYLNSSYPLLQLNMTYTDIYSYPSSNDIYAWITKEQHVKSAFLILVQRWLYKKYKRNIINENDPWTLSPPEKCVKLFDVRSRGVYIFEASSLKKHMEFSLGYSEWLFPVPSCPKNPFTNIEFNQGQLGAIREKIRLHGFSSWMIEAFAESFWDIHTFKNDNAIMLKIYSVKQLIKNPESTECRETLQEFIEQEFEYNNYRDDRYIVALKWAVKNRINDPYMIEWLQLFKAYHILKIRHGIVSINNHHLTNIHRESYELLMNKAVIKKFIKERVETIRKSNISVVSTDTNPALNSVTPLTEHQPNPPVQDINYGIGLLQDIENHMEMLSLLPSHDINHHNIQYLINMLDNDENI